MPAIVFGMSRLVPNALVVLFALAACRSAPEVDRPAIDRLALTNAHVVSPTLVSSGQVDQGQFAVLPASGIRQVVCLRPTSEDGTGWEEADAARLGLRFVRIPIDGAAALDRSNAKLLADVLADDEPTLVYCASGNRVGALLALEAYWFGGMPADQAIDYGKAAGMTRLEPQVRKIVTAQK